RARARARDGAARRGDRGSRERLGRRRWCDRRERRREGGRRRREGRRGRGGRGGGGDGEGGGGGGKRGRRGRAEPGGAAGRPVEGAAARGTEDRVQVLAGQLGTAARRQREALDGGVDVTRQPADPTVVL